MSHPFQVGGRYRNLKGAYTVESLQGSRMVICYEDGQSEATSTTFQELALIPDEPASPKRTSGHSAASPPIFDFHGLQESDFQHGTAGTSWRRRASLGGMLAYRLSTLCSKPFESLGVSRRNEVYVYQPHRYRKDKTYHEAKLTFTVAPDGVRHGFYVEKDHNPVDASWDWTRLLGLKAAKSRVGEGVLAAMGKHQLVWRFDFFSRDRSVARTGAVALSGGALVRSDDPDDTSLTWDAFLDYLAALPPDEWCDLYLEQFIPREEAIQLGVRIADHAARVWQDLAPLYLACTVPIHP